MEQQRLNVNEVGKPTLDCLGADEERSFYVTLLARVLELYRQKKEGDAHAT